MRVFHLFIMQITSNNVDIAILENNINDLTISILSDYSILDYNNTIQLCTGKITDILRLNTKDKHNIDGIRLNSHNIPLYSRSDLYNDIKLVISHLFNKYIVKQTDNYNYITSIKSKSVIMQDAQLVLNKYINMAYYIVLHNDIIASNIINSIITDEYILNSNHIRYNHNIYEYVSDIFNNTDINQYKYDHINI